MQIISKYYVVSVNNFPFNHKDAVEVGCYTTKDIAERVTIFIRDTIGQQISGGIDIELQDYEGEMVKTPIGLRLKETPNGAITLIQENLSNNEINRIVNLLRFSFQSQIIPPKSPTPTRDMPTHICEGKYYCVTLDFFPFDRSRKLFVGYYQSKQTAKVVAKYITNIHRNEKTGFGFDLNIESYQGRFVKYESGKIDIKIGEKYHEILSSCDGNEFIKISKSINETANKWSRN